jgi:hypothetical protein
MGHGDMTEATVARLLLSPATRSATFDALASHHHQPSGLLLAAASAAAELLTMDAASADTVTFRRASCFLAHLAREMARDQRPLAAAAWGNGKLLAKFQVANVAMQALRKPAAQIDLDDALNYVNLHAFEPFSLVEGWDACLEHIDVSTAEPIGTNFIKYSRVEPLHVDSEPLLLITPTIAFAGIDPPTVSDTVPPRVASLVLELLRAHLLRSQQQQVRLLPGLECAAWVSLRCCCYKRPSVYRLLFEAGAIELVAAQCKDRDADEGTCASSLAIVYDIIKLFGGESERPDIDQIVSSGLFDELLCFVQNFANRGHIAHGLLLCSLNLLSCCSSDSQCEASIRLLAPELEFCLQRDLVVLESQGLTTANEAGFLCAKVFGRDEADDQSSRGVQLRFTQQQIDGMIARWCKIMDGLTGQKPSPDSMLCLELVISDSNKALLLNNADFISYLNRGLLLEPDHPHQELPINLKAWLQTMHVECTTQLALFTPGREALLCSQQPITDSLRRVRETGLSDRARTLAMRALAALEVASGKTLGSGSGSHKLGEQACEASSSSTATGIRPEHIMLSYNWDYQQTIKRINTGLKERGYEVWIDIEKMRGSTVEAMADAVEGCAAMCYGISRGYKESANCRLEAQYAYQREKEMVPLMMEEGYRPNGWLGMMLGVRLYYVFFGKTLDSQSAFEAKLDELCHGLGQAGKSAPVAMLAPAPAPVSNSAVAASADYPRSQQRVSSSFDWVDASPIIADTPLSTPTRPASLLRPSDTETSNVLNSSVQLSEGFYVMQLELQRAAEREREKSKSEDALHSTLIMGSVLGALGVGFALGCAFGMAVTVRMTAVTVPSTVQGVLGALTRRH